MEIEFDPEKDATNFGKHGLSLEDFTGFDDLPTEVLDNRRSYGEARYRAYGFIGGVGHCLVYTVRESRMRLISFRRARAKEMRRYGK